MMVVVWPIKLVMITHTNGEKNAQYFKLFELISIKHQEEVHIFCSPLIEFGLLSNVYICCLSIFFYFAFVIFFNADGCFFRFHFRSYNIELNRISDDNHILFCFFSFFLC